MLFIEPKSKMTECAQNRGLDWNKKEFVENSKRELKKCNVLVGCTGSVASIKLLNIIEQLNALEYKVHAEVVATDNALRFFDKNSINVRVYSDEDEWQAWKGRGDPVLHIELRRWADILVIAPLDANTLGKIASGICDNLMTCVVRAWDATKPLLYAPAMNTFMWNHPVTAEQIQKLNAFGYEQIPCIEKTLVCGDTGTGAMAEVSTIVQHIKGKLEQINCFSENAQ